ncbi:MAG TPA: hypothetical protein DEH78_30680 [Solibacterales bacterium]|nr:hypothetical protein [Bryobacterales bacterium]
MVSESRVLLNKPVVFVAAEKREFSGLLRRFKEVRAVASPLAFAAEGELNGAPALAVAHGPGPALARPAALWAAAWREGAAMISTGYCGALQHDVSIGDIIVASCVHAPDTGVRYEARLPITGRAARVGVVVSVDRVIGSPEEKCGFGSDGSLAVEMEAAAVAAVARETASPFFCVRSVSDRADERFALDLNAARGEDGRFRISHIVSQAGRRPWTGVPELFRLARNGRRASKALGDFLGECQF